MVWVGCTHRQGGLSLGGDGKKPALEEGGRGFACLGSLFALHRGTSGRRDCLKDTP